MATRVTLCYQVSKQLNGQADIFKYFFEQQMYRGAVSEIIYEQLSIFLKGYYKFSKF